VPSLIPKLLSSRSKEERLKRQDSKDDIRPLSRSARKDFKEESKSSSLAISQTSTNKDEVYKSGIRIFRRENSREDVGRDNANSIKESTKGKQQEKQERTEVVGGAAKLKVTDELPNRTRYEDGKDNANDAERSSSGREEAHASIESDSTVLDAQSDEKVDAKHQDARMIDMIIAENRTQDERMREQDTMVLGNEADEKHLLASREPIESIVENQRQNNNEKETRNTTEQLLDIGSDGDVIGITNERKGSLEIGYGKRPDEFQVVSEYACVLFVTCGRDTRGRIRARVCVCVCEGVTDILCET